MSDSSSPLSSLPPDTPPAPPSAPVSPPRSAPAGGNQQEDHSNLNDPMELESPNVGSFSALSNVGPPSALDASSRSADAPLSEGAPMGRSLVITLRLSQMHLRTLVRFPHKASSSSSSSSSSSHNPLPPLLMGTLPTKRIAKLSIQAPDFLLHRSTSASAPPAIAIHSSPAPSPPSTPCPVNPGLLQPPSEVTMAPNTTPAQEQQSTSTDAQTQGQNTSIETPADGQVHPHAAPSSGGTTDDNISVYPVPYVPVASLDPAKLRNLNPTGSTDASASEVTGPGPGVIQGGQPFLGNVVWQGEPATAGNIHHIAQQGNTSSGVAESSASGAGASGEQPPPPNNESATAAATAEDPFMGVGLDEMRREMEELMGMGAGAAAAGAEGPVNPEELPSWGDREMWEEAERDTIFGMFPPLDQLLAEAEAAEAEAAAAAALAARGRGQGRGRGGRGGRSRRSRRG
ncbi:MAG: hypothetical protein M1814_000130 [Vezdaea aestivalis]|nr:MAG: hypothetical protein M1814_000130 [Vezdaea aestivalis]